ncbi:selenite/tellurite reduction operon protein ExtJ [Desulfolithobacter sp.]
MKKVVTVVMVVAFALSAGVAMAARMKCTVDSVDGDKVTMTCKKASKLKAGQKVIVKAAKKKAIEGC